MAEWKNDKELFNVIKKELFTALVGDIMDVLGFTQQFLPPQIKPLNPEMILIGRAMTVLEADCYSTRIVFNNNEEKPFGLMLEALDNLRENEVYICSGGSPAYARWGGLMTIRAKYLKAVGAVVDGYSRDTKQVLSLDFPVFSWGNYAKDQGVRGRVIDYRCPIEFPNGTRVNPRDIIIGDIDGVVAIPKSIEGEVIEKALEKARGEKVVAMSLKKGMSVQEVFKKYGIM